MNNYTIEHDPQLGGVTSVVMEHEGSDKPEDYFVPTVIVIGPCDPLKRLEIADVILGYLHGQMPLKPKETALAGILEPWAKSVARECYDYIKSQDGGMGDAAMENMVEAIQKAAECHYDRLGYKRTGA